MSVAGMGGSDVVLSAMGVSLRPVATGDYGLLYEWTLAPHNISTYMFRGETPSPEAFVTHLWNGVVSQFLVSDDRNQRPVGLVTCYAEAPRHGHAKLAAVSDGDDESRATMRGLGVFIDYLFATFGFRKLYADVLSPNLGHFGSGAGVFFDIEGRLCGHEFVDGEFVDLCILAVERGRWLSSSWQSRLGDWDPIDRSGPQSAPGAEDASFAMFAASFAAKFGLDLEHVQPEARLAEDLLFDSLALGELVAAIDPRTELPYEALTSVETVADAYHFWSTLRERHDRTPLAETSARQTIVRVASGAHREMETT